MKLSVIIVNYRVRSYLLQCLRSVFRALDGMDAEVFVVDNHSGDGSVEAVTEHYPQVKLIASMHNLGFARANNKAIREAEGDYVLLLNPDTLVGEDVLKRAVAFMDGHPDAGACGVHMLNSDGSSAPESRRGVPSPLTAFYKMSGLCAHFPKSRRYGRYYMGWLPWNEPVEIDIVSGAFCLLRREALAEVGLLDETFFMYGEDIDLSYRLLKKGWHNWYLPLRILHYKGESTQKSSFRYVHVFYEAMLIFFRKHYGHLSWLLSVPVQAGIYLKALQALCLLQFRGARRALGFFSPSTAVSPDAVYVFHGSRQNKEKFDLFCHRRGLVTEPEEGAPVYAVYDVSVYNYTSILEALASQQQQPREQLATYDPDAGLLITATQVIQ